MPNNKVLSPGDLITIDFGAVVNGYRSDMTRAVVVGEPDKKQLAVYETVKMAQEIGVQSVIAGIQGSHPYFESKKILDASPFAEFQGEGLGHGVGLFLHEQPFLQKNCAITLQENMVITIEPGIYIPGWGGIRIEDDIRVTNTGYEMITHAPRALIEI
jgi:Xaa-Pro aminopeptidase